jgi:D-glycero-alpha-D-manno-heptose-7-phosphate kinase
MIITKTPFRISLFGGGTDYPDWYREHGGAVLGTAINKYCFISVRALPPFFEHKHRIVYSHIENVQTIEQINHPSVKALFRELKIENGLEVHHDGDLPARSGLGSSSSFTVGLLNALRCSRGLMSSPSYLAEEAIRIEQNVICENVGSQDQIWAAFGGTNFIQFQSDDTFTVTPIVMTKLRKEEIQSHMMLFFTGISRIASEIAKTKIANLRNRRSQLFAMRSIADEALKIFQTPTIPVSQIGELLHESWQMKRELADNISNSQIDELYEAARKAGAIGGKLLGAGGGGFFCLFAPPEKQQAIRERLSQFVEVQIEIGAQGSRTVLYEPAGL